MTSLAALGLGLACVGAAAMAATAVVCSGEEHARVKAGVRAGATDDPKVAAWLASRRGEFGECTCRSTLMIRGL